ncbi:MAG: hypothetical protein GY717_08860 [Rhodobacteraceae bacterium]|nr:hypothetical protein [Paracoccaceae bacterium]
MSKNPIDHDHLNGKGARSPRYSRMDRIRAGEAGHVSIRMLTRRRRKGETDATLVKQYCRIERGYLA